MTLVQSKATTTETNSTVTQTADTPKTIAYRKSCDPDGVGLSHYILLDRGERKE